MPMPKYANVDDYIAAQPAATQVRLRELRAIFRAALPDATEVISYGMPTYKFPGGSLYFGAAKRHCAVYAAAVHLFPDELRGLVGEKGTLRLPLDKPIPEELLTRLLTASVAERQAAAATAKSQPSP
jgi:uncharacterized protein YdhG (YjbR/CyaY superfamily)